MKPINNTGPYKIDETYQIMDFKNNGTSAGTSDARFYLLRRCIKNNEPNDRLLWFNLKFVPEYSILWIEVHVCADTIIEISKEGILLEGDLSPALGITRSVLFQRNGNSEAYMDAINTDIVEKTEL